VHWRARFLYAGTHSFTYACVANVPGAYSLPAAKAFSTENPEVMGLSGAASFVVQDVPSVSAVSSPKLLDFRQEIFESKIGSLGFSLSDARLLGPVKACPTGCPRVGSCNLARGRCECASPAGEMLPCTELTAEPQELPAQPEPPKPETASKTKETVGVDREKTSQPSSETALQGVLGDMPILIAFAVFCLGVLLIGVCSGKLGGKRTESLDGNFIELRSQADPAEDRPLLNTPGSEARQRSVSEMPAE